MFKIETDEKVLPFLLKLGQGLKPRKGISPELQKAMALAAVELMPYAIGFIENQIKRVHGKNEADAEASDEACDCDDCVGPDIGLDIDSEDLPPQGQPFVEPWRWVEERNRWERAPGGVAGGDCWAAWVQVNASEPEKDPSVSAWAVSMGVSVDEGFKVEPVTVEGKLDGSDLLRLAQAGIDEHLQEHGFFVRDPVVLEDPALFEEVFGFPFEDT